jgi:hypothetical protein
MNSQQLRRILHSDEFTSLLNPTVKSLDEFLSTDLTFPSMCVVNFDTSNQPGSHWVAVNLTETGVAEYFDSYGDMKPNIQIESKLKIAASFKKSTLVFQGFSTVCGQYCLVFLLLRARNYSYKDIMSKLLSVDSTQERDAAINEVINMLYFGKILKKNMHVYDEKLLNSLIGK